MSSYLNIFLVPKRKDKEENKQHLLLLAYSRNNEIYDAFNESIHPIWAGNEEKYTSLTKEDMQVILDDLKSIMDYSNEKLKLYEKYAKDNPNYIEEILSLKDYIKESQDTYNTVSFIGEIVSETIGGYNDFEEVCCNIT